MSIIMTRPRFTVSPEQLRTFRIRHGFTIDEMAALMGVGARTVRRWEDGEQAISAAATRTIWLYQGNTQAFATVLAAVENGMFE